MLEELEIGGLIGTIQTTSLLRSTRRPTEPCCHSASCKRPSSYCIVKISKKLNNNHNFDAYLV